MHADHADLDGPADFDEPSESTTGPWSDHSRWPDGSSISLESSSPAPGFEAEVLDSGPTRVEVRFFSGGTEWRIRIELGAGNLTSEIAQPG